MGTRRVDTDPPVADLNAEYRPVGAMPVCIEGPVHVQELPFPDGSLISITIPNKAQHAVKQDLRRRSLTIVSKDDDIYIGRTQGEVDSSSAAFWPKGLPLILHLNCDLWVRAANTTSLVSFIAEQWTE